MQHSRNEVIAVNTQNCHQLSRQHTSSGHTQLLHLLLNWPTDRKSTLHYCKNYDIVTTTAFPLPPKRDTDLLSSIAVFIFKDNFVAISLMQRIKLNSYLSL